MGEKLFTDSKGRRDSIQILADIITISQEPTGKTRIMRMANVQYNMFQEYVEALLKMGFLEQNVERVKRNFTRERYQSTARGMQWCKKVFDVYAQLRARI
jgi:predicted transcriptional regulator